MLRSALLSFLLLTALGFGVAPTASAVIEDLHDVTLGQCDGDAGGFECCLYGMGVGFSVDTNGVPPVGPHPNCWQSLGAAANPTFPGPGDLAPEVCDGDSWASYWECCLYGTGVGFHVDLSNPRDVVGEHSGCWVS